MYKTLARRFSFAFALLGAALACQAPEFLQQYRQRLGGALHELNAIVEQFNREANAQSISPSMAIERLAANPDPLANARGLAMKETVDRREALQQQANDMSASGPIGRIAVIAFHPDLAVARGAWSDFEPALPVTKEAFIVASAAFFVFYAAARLLIFPFSRRSPKQTPPPAAKA